MYGDIYNQNLSFMENLNAVQNEGVSSVGVDISKFIYNKGNIYLGLLTFPVRGVFLCMLGRFGNFRLSMLKQGFYRLKVKLLLSILLAFTYDSICQT